MSNTLFKQVVLVEFENSEPGIVLIKSSDKITIEQVAKYYEEKRDFNPEKDKLTFINDSETIFLDDFINGYDEHFGFYMDCFGIDIGEGDTVETVGFDDQIPAPKEGDLPEPYFRGKVIATRNGNMVVRNDEGEKRDIHCGKLRVLNGIA